MSELMFGISGYNYCFNSPIDHIDLSGNLVTGWVGTNNGKGVMNWDWSDEINSTEDAKAAGYDAYLPAGSLVDNSRIGNGKVGTVYLGNNSNDCYYVEPNKTITPFQLGLEWLFARGPRHRTFRDGDYMTELLRSHSHFQLSKEIAINKAKNGEKSGNNNYELKGLVGIPKYFKDYTSIITAGATGNLAVTYLGSYKLSWKANINNGLMKIRFTIENTSSFQSATRPPYIGYKKFWQNNIGVGLDKLFESGPMSPTTQTFYLTETVNY